MRNVYMLLWLLLLVMHSGHGQQVDCSNLGFDEGTTRGWVLTNGEVTDVNRRPVLQGEVIGTVGNRHYVTSLRDGNDPIITSARIPMVAPGSTHSIRIGNTQRGHTFDRIKTTYAITPDNTLFQYKFAVVLEDNNHESFQKPAFILNIRNSAGQTIACSYYHVTAASTIDGFGNQGVIRYRNWTTGAVDLRNYVGQTITIEVTAHGCTEMRHFGYAYFDAQCLKAEITADQFCPGVDQTITLRAPEGFASYVWNTGQTTSTIQVKPVAGQRYSVTVKPFSSLNETCQLQFDHVLKVPPTPLPTEQRVTICEGASLTVGDSTYRRAGTYLTPIKRGTGRCDSLVRTILTVRPLARSTQSLSICEGQSLTVGDTVFRTSGTYTQRISRSDRRCDSLVTTQVTVRSFALSLTQDTRISPGDSVQLRAIVPEGDTYQFRWAPPEGLSCPTCAVTSAKPANSMQYTLTVDNLTTGCQKTASVIVSVGSCMVQAPNAFTPNRDGVNDVFFIPGTPCVRQIAELTIYDRWGEVIFCKQNVPASDPSFGWDGMYQGVLANGGVYAFKLRVDFVDGLTHRYQGTVTLVR